MTTEARATLLYGIKLGRIDDISRYLDDTSRKLFEEDPWLWLTRKLDSDECAFAATFASYEVNFLLSIIKSNVTTLNIHPLDVKSIEGWDPTWLSSPPEDWNSLLKDACARVELPYFEPSWWLLADGETD